MLTVPPPPGLALAGPLPVVAETFTRHLAAEQRRAWVAPSRELRLTPDARLSSEGYAPARLELVGLRALLVYYNDAFPRATPVLSKLTPGSFAAVWSELFDREDPRLVRVCERVGAEGRAVYAVTSPSYATDYTVASVVADVARLLGGAEFPCSLTYDAGELRAALVVKFERYDLRFDLSDVFGDEVARVSVVTKDGRDLGDPAPEVKKRRSTSNGGIPGATVAAGLATKITASVEFFAAKGGR